MNTLHLIFGSGVNLTPMEMSARAFVTFFIMLLMIRLGGVRIFGKKSSIDDVIAIMLGAILARGVVGSSPYLSTIAAAFIMVMIHRLLGWLSVRNESFGRIIKGRPTVLYRDGKIVWVNMEKGSISKADLMESVRLETKKNSLDDIEIAYLETNGRISFLLKE